MKPRLFVKALAALFLFYSCKSKTGNSDQPPNESIFGTYYFGSSGKIKIDLKEDSTAEMNISKTKVQESAGIGPVHKQGRFSIYNDSIFINWDSAAGVKSKFENKKGIYSFLIGSTRYQKK